MGRYTYDYPRPMVTVDCILIQEQNEHKLILLIQRGQEPFKNMWALPGGFVDMDEDLSDAAQRELLEETGIKCENLKQFATFGKPGRDPRGRTVSVVYYGIVKPESSNAVAGDDAASAQWFFLQDLPELAFDHSVIVYEFFEKIKEFDV